MRIDKDGRMRYKEEWSCGHLGSSCEAQCEWDPLTREWICHRYDHLLKCHAAKIEVGMCWYCTLEKKHTGDHECQANGITIVRWKQ